MICAVCLQLQTEKKSKGFRKEGRNLSKQEQPDQVNLVASSVIATFPQLPSSLGILQILVSPKRAKVHSSLMQSFLQGDINLTPVPKWAFTFLLEIKTCNELEAGGFVFLLGDLFGSV